MKKKITLKMSLLIAISGLILIIFGFITISILNDDVNFGSAGKNDATPDTTPTPTPTQTMDVEENPSTSPTPTPVETETPGDIVLPSGDPAHPDNPDQPSGRPTPPAHGPDGATTGGYVPPAEDEWVDETIPQEQYQLEKTSDVSEADFGRLNGTEALGVNFFFRDHTLYSIVKNGSASTISYQYFRIVGSVGTTNVFMCTWDEPGEFKAGSTQIYKCQVSNAIDASTIAVGVLYY